MSNQQLDCMMTAKTSEAFQKHIWDLNSKGSSNFKTLYKIIYFNVWLKIFCVLADVLTLNNIWLSAEMVLITQSDMFPTYSIMSTYRANLKQHDLAKEWHNSMNLDFLSVINSVYKLSNESSRDFMANRMLNNIWRPWRQKQLSQAGISNYIPQ